ncbi:hypothetical protein TSUD_142370 [Trifolium subterraneum]|uniref:Uncharacterized protein n=1 Tax=Trifolium subterraneum TaxID=3900 RepID=A0A2Z6N0Y2_TRISU|nr:hypothetical protein TSUD_142370 [Trifolium subterraneum]
MAAKRKTRSSSTSAIRDAETSKKVRSSSSSSSSGNTKKNYRRKTDLVLDSLPVKKKQDSKAVPMTIDGGKGNGGGDDEVSNSKFLGDPVPDEEAKLRWPKRYQEKNMMN